MKPLVLLVDLQNDFLGAAGFEPPAAQVVAAAARLLDGARSLGAPVVHAVTRVDREADDRMPHWKTAGTWRCVDGTAGYATPPELRPRAGETVVGKTFFSAFSAPELDRALAGADTLFLAGVHLHGCVRATVLDAYARGIAVWVAEDAVGSDDPLHAAVTRRYLDGRAARFAPVEELLARLSGRAETSSGSAASSATAAPAAAVSAARDAAASWRAASAPERCRPLLALAERFERDAAAWARELASEIGKPVTQGAAEARRTAELLRAAAGRASAGDVVGLVRAGPESAFRRVPRGIVAIVTPWNNPLAIPWGKIGPAAALGNVVVWKPSPHATGAARRSLDMARSAGLPAGVVELVEGGSAAAAALMSDPGIDAVSLTGSSSAGWAAQEICARRRIPLQAELGGNNAAVVWTGADLADAAARIARGAFGFAGQRCTANRRAVVAAELFDEFLERLERAVAALGWGDPLDPATEVGPMVSAAARDRVAAVVGRARAERGPCRDAARRRAHRCRRVPSAHDRGRPPTRQRDRAGRDVRARPGARAVPAISKRLCAFATACARVSPRRSFRGPAPGATGSPRRPRPASSSGTSRRRTPTPSPRSAAGRPPASGLRSTARATSSSTRGSRRSMATAAVPFPRVEIEGSIGERFHRVARAHAGRPAVADRGRVTTYAQLEAAAGAIAEHLGEALPDASGPVVLFCETGAPLFSAMLGALEAGRFYVPLDPRMPDARLAPIFRDLDAAAIVSDAASQSRARDLAAASRGERVLAVEDLAAAASGARTGPAAAPGDLAYVLFTSGSTGRPKGVMQSHRNVLHNVWKLTEGLRILPEDRLTLLSSPSFGASVSDIYGALLNGACVCPFDLSGDGLRRLPEFLEREAITILHAVPSAFRSLAATLDGHEDLSRLRMVKLGGEAVLASDFDLYRNRLPRGCVFHVGFGATEISVIRQWFAGPDTPWPAGTPLGYAVDGTEVVLLDGDGRSDEGEIGIVASTLAVGYWKDPALTAATFLPVEGRPEARLYRTGDLGRLLPDGCLLHLGRKDARVKVRGHRVETAEVEAALLAIPGVREAAVEARGGGAAQRLTGWIVADLRGPAANASALRRALAGRLPASMIPSRFVRLDTLPRTASGKVDRRALPNPARSRPPLEAPFREAGAGAESAIAAAFAIALDLDPGSVGADDDFFDLGGDSLSAVDLLATLEARLGQEISAAELLAAPTPALLAPRAVRSAGSPPGRLLRLREGKGRPVFVIPGGGGDGEDLFAARRIARLAGGDAPVWCLRSGGVPDSAVGAEELARLGVAEIRQVCPEGPYALVGDCVGGILAFAIARRLRADGERIALLALLDAPFPFAGRRLRSWVRAHAPRADRLWGRAAYFGERLRFHLGVLRAQPDAGARWRYLRRTADTGMRGLDPPPDARRREALALRASYVAALAGWKPAAFDGTVHLIECAESRRRGFGVAWAARAATCVAATVEGAHPDFLLGHGEEVGRALARWLRETTGA